MGQYGDIFTATDRPGLLLLHSPGNTFIRDLRPGESLLIQPSSLLYRDVSVRRAPAPGVPAEHGFRVLAPALELPEHLGPAHRPWPRRGPVGVRAAREHRYHPELARTPRTTAGRSAPGRGTHQEWTGWRNTGASVTRRARLSLSLRGNPTGQAARRASSWCKSTTRAGCTGTSGWNATGCSSPGRCRRASPTTRRRTTWPCTPRTTRWSTRPSTARSRAASTAAAPSPSGITAPTRC